MTKPGGGGRSLGPQPASSKPAARMSARRIQHPSLSLPRRVARGIIVPGERPEEIILSRITRRRFVGTAAVAASTVALRWRPAEAAEFTYKYANNTPVDHPMN